MVADQTNKYKQGIQIHKANIFGTFIEKIFCFFYFLYASFDEKISLKIEIFSIG